MEVQGKVWGTTRTLFKTDTFALCHISINKGCFCSKHGHKHKHNRFYVLSGRLRITVWQTDYDLADVTTIGPGQMTSAVPGLKHRFEATEDTEALEWYWVELSGNDIEREDVGGVLRIV